MFAGKNCRDDRPGVAPVTVSRQRRGWPSVQKETQRKSGSPDLGRFRDHAPSAEVDFGGSIGNLIEWYEFYVYNFFALYFAKSFFPNASPTVQLLNTFGIYALGFMIRPVGGWVLGVYADQAGPKAALTLSVTLMCAGSLLIAVSPTYATHRHRRAGLAAGRPADAGHFARRRIRHLGHLSQRDRGLETSWLLQLLSIRHADRRTGARQPDADRDAAGFYRGGAGSMGLAHAVRDRRGCSRCSDFICAATWRKPKPSRRRSRAKRGNLLAS